jgi:hypothetical protein
VLALANAAAGRSLGDEMRLSWPDLDRDFESPQHASECHADGAVPGHVAYRIHHGEPLMLHVEQGRIVFFYLPLAL